MIRYREKMRDQLGMIDDSRILDLIFVVSNANSDDDDIK